MTHIAAPNGDDWVRVGPEPLPLADASAWATLPRCGAVVTFTGTVRDHSEGRPGVVSLEYETYPEHVESVLADVVAETRRAWPDLGRVAALHRTGLLALEDAAVVVVVSAPHRGEAFEAARHCIDTLKHRAPIWKRETWAGGSGWSTCEHLGDESPLGAAPAPPAVGGPT